MAQAQLPQWLVGHLTYRDLCAALSDAESTVHWCQRHRLLADKKSCPKCGRDMHLVKRKAVNKEDGDAQGKVVGKKWLCEKGRFLKVYLIL